MPISKVTIKRMFKEAGADRVSNEAAAELAEIVNRYAYSIAKKAIKLSAHAKRKTIKKEDVDLAR
ncbi:MAG: NFYB/HAP3 family transcription factor subunit [Candidatus Marsarchaeota archaeon]|jgi:histone H3/H4|nr:NFYB/HAP3 family transcription factor subunit [Candidatus Marsarchaeota archaeon]